MRDCRNAGFIESVADARRSRSFARTRSKPFYSTAALGSCNRMVVPNLDRSDSHASKPSHVHTLSPDDELSRDVVFRVRNEYCRNDYLFLPCPWRGGVSGNAVDLCQRSNEQFSVDDARGGDAEFVQRVRFQNLKLWPRLDDVG